MADDRAEERRASEDRHKLSTVVLEASGAREGFSCYSWLVVLRDGYVVLLQCVGSVSARWGR